MRFIRNKVVLIADVKKEFDLKLKDRDVTRFILLKDSTKLTLEKQCPTLRSTRNPFGMISSSFLLAATVNYHLNKPDTPIAIKTSSRIQQRS